MTPKEQYERALSLARAGDYRAAKAILERMNHPKATELLQKVNAAIAKQQPKALPDYTKLQGKRNPVMFVVFGTLLALMLLIGALAIGGTIYTTMQANQEQARQRAADTYCHRLFAIEYIELEREAFDTACQEAARWAALIYPAQIDVCLSGSQNGALTQRLLDCMEIEGVIMLGYELRDALEAQEDKPEK